MGYNEIEYIGALVLDENEYRCTPRTCLQINSPQYKAKCSVN